MAKITIDLTYCKGCELCTSACPMKILELDQNQMNAKGYHPVHVTNPEKCTGCASCAIMCPDCAITVER